MLIFFYHIWNTFYHIWNIVSPVMYGLRFLQRKWTILKVAQPRCRIRTKEWQAAIQVLSESEMAFTTGMNRSPSLLGAFVLVQVRLKYRCPFLKSSNQLGKNIAAPTSFLLSLDSETVDKLNLPDAKLSHSQTYVYVIILLLVDSFYQHFLRQGTTRRKWL